MKERSSCATEEPTTTARGEAVNMAVRRSAIWGVRARARVGDGHGRHVRGRGAAALEQGDEALPVLLRDRDRDLEGVVSQPGAARVGLVRRLVRRVRWNR